MDSVRNRTLVSLVLVSTFVLLPCCSTIMRRLSAPDINGYGEIKWGMTLAEVQKLLGSRARIETDPKSGTTLEYVRMIVGGIEREGFLSTNPSTDRVRGVQFIITGPSSKETFDLLQRELFSTYDAPSIEHMTAVGPLCFWDSPSGTIMLQLFGAQGKFKGSVSLAYLENPLAHPNLQ